MFEEECSPATTDLVAYYGRDDVETALLVAWLVREYVEAALAADGGKGIANKGICDVWSWMEDQSAVYVRAVTKIRDRLYTEWPQFSGNAYYPIPMPRSMYAEYQDYIDGRNSPATGYGPNDYAYNKSRHLWDGDYGENRWACLLYIIERLEDALK